MVSANSVTIRGRIVGHSEVIPSRTHDLDVQISKLLDCAREVVLSECGPGPQTSDCAQRNRT